MQSTMSASAPLQIQSVVDQVYDAVRARILSGDLPRGSRLRQAALADELGVSRTPLREALRRLATEGLVEFEANRGATVADHDMAKVIGAIVFAYLTLVQFALVVVRRWANEMAAS